MKKCNIEWSILKVRSMNLLLQWALRASRAWKLDRLLGKDDSSERLWSSTMNYLPTVCRKHFALSSTGVIDTTESDYAVSL